MTLKLARRNNVKGSSGVSSPKVIKSFVSIRVYLKRQRAIHVSSSRPECGPIAHHRSKSESESPLFGALRTFLVE